MEYNEIMELPADTANTALFDLLKETVTEEDVKNGVKPIIFAYAHLIEWAVKNKKFFEYYSYIKQYTIDTKKIEAEKIVFVRFNCAGTPLFGFYTEEDGEPALCFPEKDGMFCVFL